MTGAIVLLALSLFTTAHAQPLDETLCAQAGILHHWRCEEWARHFDGLGGIDFANRLATSPHGEIIVIAGGTQVAGSDYDYLVVTRSASTGSLVWSATHDSDGRFDRAVDVVISPDGATVFVTGWTTTVNDGFVHEVTTTIAYDTSNGAVRWIQNFGDALGGSNPRALVIDQTGSTLFVTGYADFVSNDMIVIAYDAVTGNQKWVYALDGPMHRSDVGIALTVGSGGLRVFATGRIVASEINPGNYDEDIVTIALDALTGDLVWMSYFEEAMQGLDEPSQIAATPDGNTVLVVGSVAGRGLFGSAPDILVLAHDSADGRVLWDFRHDGGSEDLGTAIQVSVDGTTAYATGYSLNTEASWYDAVTLSLDVARGTQRWISAFSGTGDLSAFLLGGWNGGDYARSVILAPNQLVLVSGYTWTSSANGFDFLTVAYDSLSGVAKWARRFDGRTSSGATGGGLDLAWDSAVSADGKRLFVTGESESLGGSLDAAVLAYAI